jgi:hypothetical protein
MEARPLVDPYYIPYSSSWSFPASTIYPRIPSALPHSLFAWCQPILTNDPLLAKVHLRYTYAHTLFYATSIIGIPQSIPNEFLQACHQFRQLNRPTTQLGRLVLKCVLGCAYRVLQLGKFGITRSRCIFRILYLAILTATLYEPCG